MISALLSAAAEHLRSTLNLPVSQCDVQIDGQPPPAFGQFYLAVHALSWSPGLAIMEGIDEVYSIGVTLTQKHLFAPQDRPASAVYLKALSGMEIICRRIIGAIHKQESILTAANTTVLSVFPHTLKLITPLVWQGTDAIPRIETGAWVWTDDDNELNNPAALVMTNRFGDCQRTNSIGTGLSSPTYDDE